MDRLKGATERNVGSVRERRVARLFTAVTAAVAVAGMSFAYHENQSAQDARWELAQEIDATCTGLEGAIISDADFAVRSIKRAINDDPRGATVAIVPGTNEIVLTRSSETRELSPDKSDGLRVNSFTVGINFSRDKDGSTLTVFSTRSTETLSAGGNPVFNDSSGISIGFRVDNSAPANEAAKRFEAAGAVNDPAELASVISEALTPHDLSGNSNPLAFMPTEVITSDRETDTVRSTEDCRSNPSTRANMLRQTTLGDRVSDSVLKALEATPVG